MYRVIGGLGRTLIALGVLVLLFAGFQYWGTGVAEARAQDELDAEFLARLEAATVDGTDGDATLDGTGSADGSGGGLGDGPADSTSGGVTSRPPMLDLDDIPSIGDAAGRVIIPAIGVDKTFVQGVGRDDLRKGPGHYPLSPLPGQPGNAAIAGHRTTYGAPFHDLDLLTPGDEIIVETLQGRFTYEVMEQETEDGGVAGYFIVPPTATWVLDDQGDSRLTLTACHPKRSAAQRIVVSAALTSTPAPATPIPVDVAQPELTDDGIADGEDADVDQTLSDEQSLEESLGWQPEHWPATAMWAGACALVALAGWVLGRRWRRWPAHLLAAGPFLACLWVCFTHLDKLLPAF